MSALLQDPTAVRRGRFVFNGVCGGYCHTKGLVNADVPDLFDCGWIHGGSDQEIFRVVSEGVAGTRMVGFRGRLPEGDDDIWKVIAYLRSGSSCREGS